MALPYSKSYTYPGVASGVENCLELLVPPRGTLMRLIVKQTSGPVDGFDYVIYDRKDACPGVSQESCAPGDEPFSPEAHQIMEEESEAGDTSMKFQAWTPYENRDSLCDGVHAAKRSRLYLSLTPGGVGNKDFEVAVTVTTDFE